MNMPDPPGKAGLLAGAEVIKYLLALATGAIVFSAGLLTDKVALSPLAKWFILISWCVLALSVVGGILANMRVPIMLTEQNYNVEDKFLKYPGLVQQLAFVFGIVLLGFALSIILYAHTQDGQKASPTQQIICTMPCPLPSPTPMVTPSPTPATTITDPPFKPRRRLCKNKNALLPTTRGRNTKRN